MERANAAQPVRQNRLSKEIEGPRAVDDKSVARVEQNDSFTVNLPTHFQQDVQAFAIFTVGLLTLTIVPLRAVERLVSAIVRSRSTKWFTTSYMAYFGR